MNRRPLLATLGLALLSAGTAGRAAPAAVGQPAPEFRATDTAGRTVSLSDFRGRHVVLEWVNPGCPFVQKHYGAGNMQALQRLAAGQGVAWLAVNSTATDHGDHLPPAAMAAWMERQKAQPTATLMDADGTVGRAYGARVTPHMFLIDPAGRLLYAGAIDSKPTAHPADIATAVPHLKQALAEALAGQQVGTPATKAYGCTIKYAGG